MVVTDIYGLLPPTIPKAGYPSSIHGKLTEMIGHQCTLITHINKYLFPNNNVTKVEIHNIEIIGKPPNTWKWTTHFKITCWQKNSQEKFKNIFELSETGNKNYRNYEIHWNQCLKGNIDWMHMLIKKKINNSRFYFRKLVKVE